MTREEAVKVLMALVEELNRAFEMFDEDSEALDMAIDALRALSIIDEPMSESAKLAMKMMVERGERKRKEADRLTAPEGFRASIRLHSVPGEGGPPMQQGIVNIQRDQWHGKSIEFRFLPPFEEEPKTYLKWARFPDGGELPAYNSSESRLFGDYVIVTSPENPDVISGVINELSKRIAETVEKHGPARDLVWIVRERTMYDEMRVSVDVDDDDDDEAYQGPLAIEDVMAEIAAAERKGPVWIISWKARFGG